MKAAPAVPQWAQALELSVPFVSLTAILVAFRPMRSALWDWRDDD